MPLSPLLNYLKCHNEAYPEGLFATLQATTSRPLMRALRRTNPSMQLRCQFTNEAKSHYVILHFEGDCMECMGVDGHFKSAPLKGFELRSNNSELMLTDEEATYYLTLHRPIKENL